MNEVTQLLSDLVTELEARRDLCREATRYQAKRGCDTCAASQHGAHLALHHLVEVITRAVHGKLITRRNIEVNSTELLSDPDPCPDPAGFFGKHPDTKFVLTGEQLEALIDKAALEALWEENDRRL